MNSLNSVLLEGDLVSDAELSYTEKNVAICRFKLQCYRSFKAEEGFVEEVSYFDIVSRMRLAEICAEYVKKGRGIRVVGRLKQEVEKVVIEAEHVEFKPLKKMDRR